MSFVRAPAQCSGLPTAANLQFQDTNRCSLVLDHASSFQHGLGPWTCSCFPLSKMASHAASVEMGGRIHISLSPSRPGARIPDISHFPAVPAWEPQAWHVAEHNEILDYSPISLCAHYLSGLPSRAQAVLSSSCPFLNSMYFWEGSIEWTTGPMIPTICLSPPFHAWRPCLEGTVLRRGCCVPPCPLGCCGWSLVHL